MSLLTKILGIRDCSACGTPVSTSWSRSSNDRWTSFSTNPKVDKCLELVVKVETKGLCQKCFSSRADKAVAAAREFFRDVVPEGQKF